MTAVAPRPRTAADSAEALVDAALDGDELAWQQLAARHTPEIRAVAMARLRDEHAADDVVQETLLRAWSRLHQLEDSHRLASWMKTIAARVAVDHVRGRRQTEALDNAPELVCAAPRPDESALLADEARILHGHLDELREADRVALWQRDGLGASVGEVAEQLGMTTGSVRVLLTRARGKVRASYGAFTAPVVALGLRLRERLAGLGEAVPAAVVAPAVVVAATVGIVAPDWGGADGADSGSVSQMIVDAPDVGDGGGAAPDMLTVSSVSTAAGADAVLVNRGTESGRTDTADAAHDPAPQPARVRPLDQDADVAGARVSREPTTEGEPDGSVETPEESSPIDGVDVFYEDIFDEGSGTCILCDD